MKSLICAAVVVYGLALSGQSLAQADLAKKDGCMNCHDVATKKVGPAFKDVAAKYKGNAGAEATLVSKITAGKDHPAVKGASEDDVKKLVKWVLSM
ncbi:MAG: c-type cytochrome [Betaproteobacteria bacterium]|nr:MAG: c-type cytochrome [Betaproteobacteria bacterium]